MPHLRVLMLMLMLHRAPPQFLALLPRVFEAERSGLGKYGMAWYGTVDVCDGCLAAEASRSSFG